MSEQHVEGLVRACADVEFVAPPESVWDRIAAEIGPDGGATAETYGSSSGGPSNAGASSAVPPVQAGDSTSRSADVASGAQTAGTPPGRDRSGLSRREVLGWSLAGVVGIGVGVGASLVGRASAELVARTDLRTLDGSALLGVAEVLRENGRYALKVTSSQFLRDGADYIEVWLINSDLKRMISVGVWGGAESATYEITREALDQGFVVADVSKEMFDGTVTHSGDSLARGVLPWS